SGKTSLIQSLLIAREVALNQSNVLRLNGPFGLELGAAEDVLNWVSKSPIRITIEDDESGYGMWQFDVLSPDALYLGVTSRSPNLPLAFNVHPRSFTYLCAERFGPRSILGSSPLPDHELEVGVQGEYCAHVLSVLGSKILEDESRKHPSRQDTTSMLLKYEVEQWLGEIARPVEITAERLPGSSVVKMSFRSHGGEWVSAPNMGFGISYALPIILSGLIARFDGLMIVENPEAHLHPAGQSRMGVFLAWLASKGVQVVLETHSDHVLNGIRRAIGEHRFLPAESALAYFFREDQPGEPHPLADQLRFSNTGGISHWPPGFFDQYQIDVASLGRIRRQH
ncbi:DUF3696 domain-containing protein, partial [Parvibaculum sp.]